MKAVARYVRIPPRKARLAIDLVRGKQVDEALVILQQMPNKSARIARKVLESAVANAVHNAGLDSRMLFVARAYVDEGPRWKRICPRSRARVPHPQAHQPYHYRAGGSLADGGTPRYP
jgi:large subunit ribosomal protein L22